MAALSSIPSVLRTLHRLGLRSVTRVLKYRLALRVGMHPVLRLPTSQSSVDGPFFDEPESSRSGLEPRGTWVDHSRTFGYEGPPLEGVPDWGRGMSSEEMATPWSSIPDFAPGRDIKTVWEFSRMDWVIALSQRAALGQDGELARLNAWLADWWRTNPPYLGPNWKCGQEASIRVLHLAAGAVILDGDASPTAAIEAMLVAHARRIAPTMDYAIGQRNNHGISEAAALFIVGTWLPGNTEAAGWVRIGREWIQRLVLDLFEPDGTFSQYSVTYQRLAVDVCAFVEIWRRRREGLAFSQEVTDRLEAASRWLQHLVDPVSGDAPNLGANDGALVLAMTDTDYRDFRPSVQRASAIFLERRAYDCEECDMALRWLGCDRVAGPVDQTMESVTMDHGGLHVLRSENAVAYLRYPRFRFRPSHADALHLDLWVGGENILRDGGSYSYADPYWHHYFTGVESHNTAQFDGCDQMPRLGRFLFGDWLATDQVSPVAEQDGVRFAGAVCSHTQGGHHDRRVELSPNSVLCRDQLSGEADRAIIRWRLRPGSWAAEGNSVTDGSIRLEVCASGVMDMRIRSGWESRYYLRRLQVPVLEIEVPVPCEIVTRVEF